MSQQYGETAEALRQHIIDSVTEAFEMAFIDVEPIEDQANFLEKVDWLNVNALYTAILIDKPFPAELRLITPRPLAIMMAQNMYVMDESGIEEQMLNDMVAEMLNVIAGRLMAAILPPNTSFHLGLPELGEESFLQADVFSIAVDFDAEEHPLWLVALGEGFLQR